MRAKIAKLYANPVGGSLYGEVMSFSRPNIDRAYSIPVRARTAMRMGYDTLPALKGEACPVVILYSPRIFE
jgi:hypothetical protein